MITVKFDYTQPPYEPGSDPIKCSGAATLNTLEELTRRGLMPGTAYNIKLEFDKDTKAHSLWDNYPIQRFMIDKSLLIHGNYYAGKCRNANIARWDAERSVFVHWRTKFGTTFLEEISYFTPEGQFDEFIPLFNLGGTLPSEIPFKEKA